MKDKKKLSRTRRWRRDVWRELSHLGFPPSEIHAGFVLVGVMTLGTDPSALSDLTGLNEDYVKRVLKRLRQQRIVVGQTVRSAMFSDEPWHAEVGAALDVGTAAGIFTRSPDPKRSVSQRARAPETRARGPRRKAPKLSAGAVFSPKPVKSNSLYGLPGWDKQPASTNAVDPANRVVEG